MFRFSIRDLLWLTVVVAMGAAWWAERNQKCAIATTCSELRAENGYLQQFIASQYE
jgi:hypothetical protein